MLGISPALQRLPLPSEWEGNGRSARRFQSAQTHDPIHYQGCRPLIPIPGLAVKIELTMKPDINPYTPPVVTPSALPDQRDASWYLHSVQKYYRRMGIAMLTYICIVAVLSIAGQALEGSITLASIGAPLIWCSLLVWLCAAMIKIGYVSPDDFPSCYRKARWVGIIAGAMFLPILGLPAFISLRRLSRYNSLTQSFGKSDARRFE